MSEEIDFLDFLSADHTSLSEMETTDSELELAVAKHLWLERRLFYPLLESHGICSVVQLEQLQSVDKALEASVVATKPISSDNDIKESIEKHVSGQEQLFSIVRDKIDAHVLNDLASKVPLMMVEGPRHIHTHIRDRGPLMEI